MKWPLLSTANARLAAFTERRRAASGEARFTIGLGVWNVFLVLLLVGGLASFGLCSTNPDRADVGIPVALPGAVQAIGDAIALAAVAVALVQLVPGPPRWRDVRARLGVANLMLLWPAVVIYAVATYLAIDEQYRSCVL